MKHGAWDMVRSGDKRIEFRKDNTYHTKRLTNKTHLRLYRGFACWESLPHLDVEIVKIHHLPHTYSQLITYPNLFQITLTGPLLAIQLGAIDNVVMHARNIRDL